MLTKRPPSSGRGGRGIGSRTDILHPRSHCFSDHREGNFPKSMLLEYGYLKLNSQKEIPFSPPPLFFFFLIHHFSKDKQPGVT